MNDLPPAPLWDLLSAHRRSHDRPHAPAAKAPDFLPPWFPTRAVARWSALRRDESFRFWSRWSFRAALGGLAAVCLVLLFSKEPPTDSGMLLDAPALGIPGLATF